VPASCLVEEHLRTEKVIGCIYQPPSNGIFENLVHVSDLPSVLNKRLGFLVFLMPVLT
jgi:hypothetical protein